jgi:hypothetical protein
MTEQAFGSPIAGPASFRFGDMLKRSFDIFGRHFLLLFILLAVLMTPTLYLQIQVNRYTPQIIAELAKTGTFANTDFLWTLLYGWLGTIVGQTIAHALVTVLAFQALSGRPVDLGEGVGRLLARLLPYLAMVILVFLAVVFSMLLLIIPGIIVAMIFAVAQPVCLIEKLGPIASLSRSAALTKGNRWVIFAAYLVYGLVGGGAGAILRAIVGRLATPEMAIYVSYPVSVAVAAFGAVMAVAIYAELRLVKEGGDTGRLASVFD